MYVTSTKVQHVITLRRQIDHADAMGYGTPEQHERAHRMLVTALMALDSEERAMYDEVIEFYRDNREMRYGT